MIIKDGQRHGCTLVQSTPTLPHCDPLPVLWRLGAFFHILFSFSFSLTHSSLCVGRIFERSIFASTFKGKNVPFYAKFAKTICIAASRLIVCCHPTVNSVQLSFRITKSPILRDIHFRFTFSNCKVKDLRVSFVTKLPWNLIGMNS